jgi:hypothetical protein
LFTVHVSFWAPALCGSPAFRRERCGGSGLHEGSRAARRGKGAGPGGRAIRQVLGPRGGRRTLDVSLGGAGCAWRATGRYQAPLLPGSTASHRRLTPGAARARAGVPVRSCGRSAVSRLTVGRLGAELSLPPRSPCRRAQLAADVPSPEAARLRGLFLWAASSAAGGSVIATMDGSGTGATRP